MPTSPATTVSPAEARFDKIGYFLVFTRMRRGTALTTQNEQAAIRQVGMDSSGARERVRSLSFLTEAAFGAPTTSLF